MKLVYHKGNNFGDALNSVIFEYFLPDFFDDDEEVKFLGIGSVLGLLKPTHECKKMIVFSTGFANGDMKTYGSVPTINDKYDIVCVRGFLTAKVLEIDAKKVISDGAILLPLVLKMESLQKKHDFSYIPHVGSLEMFDKWEELLDDIQIKFIDPRKSVEQVVAELYESRVVFAEAMHGAIVADAYRVNWVPVKSSKTINDFKWRDFLSSLEMDYNPTMIPPLYSKKILKGIFLAKFKTNLLATLASSLYYGYQKWIVIPKCKRQLTNLKNKKKYLSDSVILSKRQNQLIEKLEELKLNYKRG